MFARYIDVFPVPHPHSKIGFLVFSAYFITYFKKGADFQSAPFYNQIYSNYFVLGFAFAFLKYCSVQLTIAA